MNSDVAAEGYRMIKCLEDMAKRHGFSIGTSRHNTALLALLIVDSAECDYPLPIYSRNLEFMTGTANELLNFLRGWHKRCEYEKLLKVDRVVQNREESYRQKVTLELLKQKPSTERTL
jgi:hypothetical protein